MSKKYVCKICNKEVAGNHFPSHVKKDHNLEISEYYVKYIDPVVPKCRSGCGRDLKFWKMSHPYGSTCGHPECVSRMHSETMTELNYKKEFQKLANEGQRNAIATKPELLEKKRLIARSQLEYVNYEFLTLKDRQFRGRAAKLSHYLKSDEKKGFTERYLYIVDFMGSVKIGIYRVPRFYKPIATSRLREYMDSECKVYNLILFKGNNVEILYLEDQIVREFYEFRDEVAKYSTETFKYEKREEIILRINELINSTTIEKVLDAEEYHV